MTGLYLTAAALAVSVSVSPLALAGPNCDKNPTHPNCTDASGGDIPLVCNLASDRAVDTLLGDGMGDYIDGQDNVTCSTGATGRPNLSGIVLQTSQGNYKSGKKRQLDVRKLDLVLRRCDDVDPVNCSDDYDVSFLPTDLFQTGYIDGVDWDYSKMEYAYVSVRPYKSDQTDIQLLEPGRVYPMGLLIAPGPNSGTRINLASRVVASDNGQGVICEENPAATTTDVNVYVWPDVAPVDGVPDGYTVTTGTFDAEDHPTTLTPGSMRASICSTEGPLDCGTGIVLCNYLGQVDMQFTLDAWVR